MPKPALRLAAIPSALLALGLHGLPALAAPGVPLEAPRTVGLFDGSSDHEPRIAVAPDGRHAIAWTRFDYDPVLEAGSFNVYVRAFAADGTALGPEQRANQHEPDYQFEPQVAIADDGSFMVAWLDIRDDFTRSQVRARRYGPDGQPRGDDFSASGLPVNDIQSFGLGMAGDGRSTVVTESNLFLGSFPVFVATSTFTGRNFAADGSARGLPYRVGGRFGFEAEIGYVFLGGVALGTAATNLAVAVDDDGDVAVAWGGATGGGSIQGFYGTGIDLAATNTAVLLRRFDASGRARGLGTVVDRGTAPYYSAPFGAAASGDPQLDYGDGGDLVIAWRRPQGAALGTGSGRIAARRYSAGGLPLTAAVTAPDAGVAVEHAVAAAPGGGFVVAWQQRDGLSYTGTVRARAFGPAGLPLGPSFTDTGVASVDQSSPAVGIARDSGSIHLVWDRAGTDLQTRRYSGQ